jgi:glycosyltransferase involved in cell wall biosynthesis
MIPKQNIFLSVVIPLFDERENVFLLYHEIGTVLGELKKPYEIIFVDDGSNDGTRSVLKELAESDSTIRVILFRKNFGQSAAMAAGFKASRGDIVVTLDGDMQNDPRDILELLKEMEKGYDVVSGWRKDRKDKMFLRKIPSQIANWLICSVTDLPLHDTGCSLKAFRREVIQRLRLYGELHRFIPALSKIEGARISEIIVNHRPRRYGKSKYNLSRTFRVLMDLSSLNLFIKYLRNPLRFFGKIGVWFFLFGILGLLWMGYIIFIQKIQIVDLNVIMTLLFLLWVAGFQFMFIGFIANLIVRTGNRRKIFPLASFLSYQSGERDE